MFLITIVTSCLSLYSNPHPHPAEIDSGPPVPLAYFRPWLSPKNTDTQFETNPNSLHIWYLSQLLISLAKKTQEYLLHIWNPKKWKRIILNLACLCGQVLLQGWQRILGRKRVDIKGGKLEENKHHAQNKKHKKHIPFFFFFPPPVNVKNGCFCPVLTLGICWGMVWGWNSNGSTWKKQTHFLKKNTIKAIN